MSNLETDYEFMDVTEFTRNVKVETDSNNKNYIVGEGVFDVIVRTLIQHLQAQFDNQTIRGEDWAKYYVVMLESAQKTAIELILKKTIAEKQQALVDAQIASEEAKADLYKRQAKGFDDDAKQKLLKILMDAWGMGFSVASTDPNLTVPQTINKDIIDSLSKNILINSNLGNQADGSIDLNNNPFSGYI